MNGTNVCSTKRMRKTKNNFYMGVMDIEVKCGTINDMKIVDEYRIFNNKFVKSPDLALLLAFDERNERWKKNPSEIMKDVIYDPNEKEWKRTILETTNGHTPTPKQMKKWENGEYILNLITEYVQVMKTDLIGDENMIKDSINNWILTIQKPK